MISPGALAGVKVVDLSRVLGGPYATMILSDHGAEVIKVEPPQGDETRDWGPPFDPEHGAAYFAGVNRNKRSLGLDLSKPAGRDVLLRLLADADILVENFKTGTMERWGIGYHTLAVQFPRLIHCRVSGFGADGPLGGLPGYDAVIQGMVGLMSINGPPSTGALRIGTPVVDLATGLYSVIGILMALQERARSGLGQFIDMTLHDCGVALLHPSAANYLMSGKRPAGLGNPHSNIAPYEKYATGTCEIFLAVGNDGQFAKLAAMIGAPEIAADPRFIGNAARIGNVEALRTVLTAAFATQDGYTLAQQLAAAGVPAGPVLGVDEAMESPHVAHRDMVTTTGGVRAVNTPIKLSRTPGGGRTEPPQFGADGPAILAEHGFTETEIATLGETGIVWTERRK
jgi:crotonobetainyl-CoA:carnitine CoA-transferase CaiB-like acyl-CoA transferase